MNPWRLLPALLACVLATDGIADTEEIGPSSEQVTWRCWYDLDVHITCVIDTISQIGMFERMPNPIPSIAEEMRRDYGPKRKFFIHIPLHTEPDDPEFTALLARSSVCGSLDGCVVDFSMQPPSAEEIDALLMRGLPAAEAGNPSSSVSRWPPDSSRPAP